jgi:enoyl-CoA hydratase/isomerase-like protein
VTAAGDRAAAGYTTAADRQARELDVDDLIPLDRIRPRHFGWAVEARVATITLDRPERKNPLTFESYRELADTFAALKQISEVKVVVLTGAGGNFCSGGDVHEIIGPLVAMRDAGRTDQLLAFTRLTGELVREMRRAPARPEADRHAYRARVRGADPHPTRGDPGVAASPPKLLFQSRRKESRR